MPVIAAELQNGNLNKYVKDKVFDTDVFVIECLFPMLKNSINASGADPRIIVAGFAFAISTTLRDPLLRTKKEGVAGSFAENEIELADKQVAIQRLVRSPSLVIGNVYLKVMEEFEKNHRKRNENGRFERLPAGISFFNMWPRVSIVTISTEETPQTLLMAMLALKRKSSFSPRLRSIANLVSVNQESIETQEKNVLTILDGLAGKSASSVQETIFENANMAFTRIGFGPTLDAVSAALMPGTMLSTYAEHHERQGFSLAASYSRAREDVIKFYETNPGKLKPVDLARRFLKDNLFNDRMWNYLVEKNPALADDVKLLRLEIAKLDKLYDESEALGRRAYNQIIDEKLDISLRGLTFLSPALAVHASSLVDDAFATEPIKDRSYPRFRESIMMYLREAAPAHNITADPKRINRIGLENASFPDLSTMSGGPMLGALKDLRTALVKDRVITGWQFELMQKLILHASMAATGVDKSSMPPELRKLAPLVEKYYAQLIRVVGIRGHNENGVLFGLLANDRLIPGFAKLREPVVNEAKQQANVENMLELSDEPLPEDDVRQLFFTKSSVPALSAGVIAECRPEFFVRDGALNMLITLRGQQYVLRDLGSKFNEIFIPAWMRSVSLKGDSQAVVENLNKAMALTQAMMGGEMPNAKP
ncbi:hypothetical protein [Noviherbaspirillum humi]|uniref:hypothetical protein n=1 Tax=Noviherbaspirillum humi TaxID=1688639 RepID=UPI001160B9F9|nr:hypothetical protein [Noviherbaspirillum humi]